jgi:hypothetical protein
LNAVALAAMAVIFYLVLRELQQPRFIMLSLPVL